jgi:glycosyltransferase involved in cell wall biosynthesis
MEVEDTSRANKMSNEIFVSVVSWIVGEHMCKVSIIMPVYNKEKYIEKAVQSVLQQTFEDWELLIIDDGSTDSSLQKCQSFHDERIKVVQVENGGVSRARNIGLDMAKGEYVTFVDGDDYLAKDYLQELYVPGNEIILGGLTKVNLSGVFLGAVLPKLKGRKSIQEVAKTFYEEQLASGIYGFVASKMIRRDVIEKNRLRFDERIRLAEDYEFFLKVWRFILSNEKRCRCYVRYYYSIYFNGDSVLAHKKLMEQIVAQIAPIFKEEADVHSIMHSIFTTFLAFAIRVYNGELEDNEINRPHIFNVLYCMAMTYFKDSVK